MCEPVVALGKFSLTATSIIQFKTIDINFTTISALGDVTEAG